MPINGFDKPTKMIIGALHLPRKERGLTIEKPACRQAGNKILTDENKRQSIEIY
jgi:hypothetical protein